MGLNMAKILVLEDDPEFAAIISEWLSFDHHTVELVATGTEGLERLQIFEYELVILDLGLPGIGGLEILRTFRAQGAMTPVLILTGKRAMENKIEGFETGADDYLTKPFHGKELSVRVTALLRRPQALLSKILTHGNLELDPDNFVVRRNSEEIHLLPKEFALLQFMMRNPKRIFVSDELLMRVWPSESEATVDALTTCIKRLRQKLDRAGEPSVIRNVHGVGYGLFLAPAVVKKTEQ